MPIPFTIPFAQLASATWPLPSVLALVLLAMAVCAALGVRDLLTAIRPPIEGDDRHER